MDEKKFIQIYTECVNELVGDSQDILLAAFLAVLCQSLTNKIFKKEDM